MSVDFQIVELANIADSRGNLTFLEAEKHAPFSFKRVYYIHGLTPDAVRGGHAHLELNQLMIAINGSFEITLDSGKAQTTIILDSPHKALWIKPMTWRDLTNFSDGAICLVLASEHYSENDYIRVYEDFLERLHH